MQFFRNRLLLGDPYESWTPGWDLAGRPGGWDHPVTLSGPAAALAHLTWPCAADVCHWFAQGYRPDAGTPGGVYQTDFGGAPGPDLGVAASPPPPRRKRQYTVLGPGRADTADAMTQSLRAGRPVWLSAGRHYLEKEVVTYGAVRPWVDGVGAAVERLPDPPARQDGYGTRMFYGCQDLTLRGLDLRPWYLVGHADPPTTNWRMVECRVAGNGGGQTTGWGQSDVHFERNEFAGAKTHQPGLYLGNRYRGPRGGPEFLTPVRPGGIVFIDNEIDGCPRGVVVNTNYGTVEDCLFAGTKVHGLRDDNNGNEAWLVEGAHAYDRNLHVHDRVWDCDGPAVSLWDAPCADDKFVDLVQEGGLGIWLCDASDRGQVRVVFDTWELRRSLGVTIGWTDGAGAPHGAAVRDCVLRNGSVVGWGPSAVMNQGNYGAGRLGRRYVLDGVAGAFDRNRVEHTAFRDLPAGVGPWQKVPGGGPGGAPADPSGIDTNTVS